MLKKHAETNPEPVDDKPLRAAHGVSTQRKNKKTHQETDTSATIVTLIPDNAAGIRLLDALERIANAEREAEETA